LLSHVRISKEIYERNKADPLNLNVMIVMQDLATDINPNAIWKNIPNIEVKCYGIIALKI
jgi:hypothetical protein